MRNVSSLGTNTNVCAMWCAHGSTDAHSSLLGNDAVIAFERASWRWTHQGSVALYGRSRRHSPHKILPALQLLTGPACLFSSRSTFHSADCTSTSKCLSCRRNWAVLGRTATTSGYRTALYVGCWCLTFSIRWLTDGRNSASLYRGDSVTCEILGFHVLGGVTVLRNLWSLAFPMILVPASYWVGICDRSDSSCTSRPLYAFASKPLKMKAIRPVETSESANLATQEASLLTVWRNTFCLSCY